MAVLIITLWLISTVSLMSSNLSFKNPILYVFVLIQMHLYTGLFITAHDAMHGTVAPKNKNLNNFLGQVCTVCYALFPFQKLFIKHHQHHQFVHSEQDPDFYNGNFFVWYFQFFKQYITWWQILGMAIIYNILKIWITEQNLLLFWVVPSLLSTLQLFYFGTYLPHKGEHENRHQSKTQKKNHLWAFLSCYFFGYHYEHHDSPATPWWKLWQEKEKNLKINNG
ncbi:MAG: fatty acid desaturase [Bacteroidetes bacterium]|nr:fatty acid desaturase [Bacteroidota bacterium]MBU1484381.1 fatty acid desaturase [Bacteroidota bacterium]MBU2268607.1 fatty acid desaturase [Bacteroidota bacterium]MBU2374503.1 fatty acid desaturase [Bacteroidota bacterium]